MTMQHLLQRFAFIAVALCFSAGPSFAQQWQVLKDCRLVPHNNNDGDSFYAQCDGKQWLLRLYFVDAPETDTAFPARVEEQARYFGITPQQAVQLGGVATQFTREKLGRPFTVRTAMQDARGQSKMKRYFAFVETHEGDLAELLVANGLARVYGASAAPVGLASPQRQWKKLERLEAQAKQQKVGGWGAKEGRMTARAETQPSRTGPDSFDAFFHPQKAESTPAATPPPRTATAPTTSKAAEAGGKLDVNTATAAELEALKGIGPVLVERIIAARPFTSADELQRVKGIGPKKYEQIRPYFRD
jgi:competence ComEA-like helix-hairpin-helix protein